MSAKTHILLILLGLPVIAMAFEMNPEMKKYLETAVVTEDGVPSGETSSPPSPFRNYLQTNWRDILENIESVAPTRRQQSVLMATAAFFPSEEYLKFVGATLDGLEKGKLDSGAVRDGVIFPGQLRYGFLAVNYRNPQVQVICDKAKRLFPNDTQLQQYVNAILSGDAKEQAEEWASMNDRKPPEVLAAVTPPAPPDAAPVAPTPTTATPVATATPIASPAPATPVAQTPAATVERKSPVWPWLVGIALVVIVAVALKRRA